MNETENKLPENEIAGTESPQEAPAPAADEKETSAEDRADIHSMDSKQLLDQLRSIVERGDTNAHREVAALKAAFYNRRNRESLDELSAWVAEGNSPETFSSSVSPEEATFRDLLTSFKESRSRFLEEEDRRLNENLARKQEILKEMRAISEDIDSVNVNFQRFQQLQQDFREKADLPPTAETETWKTFQQVSEEFYDRLKINKELRDLDFRKNLELKKELIEEAKGLLEKEDVIEAARSLQAIHNRWREIGPVAKEIRNELWEEFKGLSAQINRRHQDFFESRKASEQEAEARKEALCLEAEAVKTEGLDTFAAWDEATKTILDLQARWKESGHASRRASNELFNRFRALCDAFFTAKSDFYKKTRQESNDNLALKLALCEKAEALAGEENMKKACEEATRLQAEWKTIGGVGRKRSDEVWKRFSQACNAVFDRRHEFLNGRRQEENKNLEAKKALIDRLKELDQEGDARENLKVVKEAQAEWNTIGFVPVKVKEKLWQEFRGLCDIFYDADRGQARRQRENRNREKVQELRAAGPRKVETERDRILRDIERKTNDLNTFENNMGFFMVKSSAGNSMVKEMERRSARLKEEIADLRQRLKMLDRKPEPAAEATADAAKEPAPEAANGSASDSKE